MWYRIASGKKLIILRGISGSGKSTKAQELVGDGVILGSDEFWGPEYNFDREKLGDAHKWNQDRVEQAMMQGISPIVCDNTNVSNYEIRPYAEMALKHGYSIEFAEPDTPWKFDAQELAKRNKHGTPIEVIEDMLKRWEHNPNIDDILKSKAPWELDSENELNQ